MKPETMGGAFLQGITAVMGIKSFSSEFLSTPFTGVGCLEGGIESMGGKWKGGDDSWQQIPNDVVGSDEIGKILYETISLVQKETAVSAIGGYNWN